MKVKEVWDGFARQYGSDSRASTPDKYLIELEIRTLWRYLRDKGRMLDIGCGNGYSDVKIFEKKDLEITGVDISEELIELAKNSTYVVKFMVGDVSSEDFGGKLEPFDIVLTKRTIINILTWEEQMKTLHKIYELVKPNGQYFMMEATVQGHDKIGQLREALEMSKTPIRWHNNYLDMERLVPFLKTLYKDVRVIEFSSTYYLISRVIYPFILKFFHKEPSYLSWVNKIACQLPNIGNCGLQKMVICTK